MSNGTVTQIIGAVIDVEFDKDNIPKVYEALMVDESGTTLEVQQQLGDDELEGETAEPQSESARNSRVRGVDGEGEEKQH